MVSTVGTINTSLALPGEFIPEKILRAEAEPIWQLPIHFHDINPDERVGIVVPGYRDAGLNGKNNVALRETLTKINISALTLQYSGCKNFDKDPDPATLDTHIADLNEAIAFAGDREHYLISHSFGIIPAFAAINKNTFKIIVVTPMPYLFNEAGFNIRKPLKKAMVRRAVDQTGYAYSVKKDAEPGTPPFKLTREFEKSAAKKEMQIEYLAAHTQYKRPVVIIRHTNDKNFPDEDAQSLEETLLRHQFPCEVRTIEGDKHYLLPQTLEEITKVLTGSARPEIVLT